MAGWPGGRVAGWLGGLMVGWPGGGCFGYSAMFWVYFVTVAGMFWPCVCYILRTFLHYIGDVSAG